jgi:ABC-type branched-subunit amino acid transport system substrate-binding protein
MLAASIHVGELTKDVCQHSSLPPGTFGPRLRCSARRRWPAVPVHPPRRAAQTGAPASAEPIKIGYVWGITGATADIVRPASEATHAYFDDLNKHGGIHGHPVEMVEIDTHYQVPLAQEGYKKVTTDDHVPLVILASTGDTEALAPQVNADEVVALTFSCDEKWAQPRINPSIFTICTTYQDQMRSALQFIKQRARGSATRVAFSYPDNSVWPVAARRRTRQRAESRSPTRWRSKSWCGRC